MKKRNVVKRIWAIILAAMAVLLLVRGTMAIYTSQVYQRAVVRNRYNDVIRFSSDKLYRVTGVESPQKYYYPVGESQRTMTFSVCNYDQANNTLFSEKEIEYNISFKITNGTDKITNSTDDFEYTVSCGVNRQKLKNGASLSMPGTLEGGNRSVDTYSVEFNESDFNKVQIEVKVTPTDPSLTQNSYLSAVLIPIKHVDAKGVKLSYEFIDQTRGTPDQFDAYNLLVSVSGGAGEVLISWNATELDIDPFFKASKGTPVTAENGYSTLTVFMNSEDETGTYLISFYNHKNTPPEWTEWKNLPITVALK